ncbi:MAG: anaerobic ribonucleoside-triphosphate reductase activating protein [bacterium]
MIRAFIQTSLVDWDGKIASVLFFDRCNFRCPFCQNWRLIIHPEEFPVYDFDEILKKIKQKKGWIDGIVLTGGEPLLFYNDILTIAQKIKANNLSVKLDTNGSFPELLQSILELKLIDYVAMDIKAPLDENYYIAVGKKQKSEKHKNLIKKIIKSLQILIDSGIDYEIRTTCVPGLIDESAIRKIGGAVKGAKKWVLQRFISINAFKKDYRNKQYDEAVLKRLLMVAQEYIPETKLR